MASEHLAELRWKVWEQLWNQSRHLETMRSQYLGFFFTFALGTTVFAAKEIADDGLGTSSALAIVAVLALGMDLLAAFLLLAVARIGDVLRQYQLVQMAIEEDVSEGGDAATLPAWLNLPRSAPRSGASHLRSTQGTAEAALATAVAALPAGLALVTVRAATVSGADTATVIVCAVSLVSALAISAGCIWARRGQGGGPSEPKPPIDDGVESVP